MSTRDQDILIAMELSFYEVGTGATFGFFLKLYQSFSDFSVTKHGLVLV